MHVRASDSQKSCRGLRSLHPQGRGGEEEGGEKGKGRGEGMKEEGEG